MTSSKSMFKAVYGSTIHTLLALPIVLAALSFHHSIADEDKYSPPAASIAKEKVALSSTNLIQNGDMETSVEVNGKKRPAHWTKGAEVAGIIYYWKSESDKPRNTYLSIAKIPGSLFPIAKWSQTIDLKDSAQAILVSAKVKVAKVQRAVINAILTDAEGRQESRAVSIIGELNGGNPVTHGWKIMNGAVRLDDAKDVDGTLRANHYKSITIEFQNQGTGELCFDDVEVWFERDNKKVIEATDLLASQYNKAVSIDQRSVGNPFMTVQGPGFNPGNFNRGYPLSATYHAIPDPEFEPLKVCIIHRPLPPPTTPGIYEATVVECQYITPDGVVISDREYALLESKIWRIRMQYKGDTAGKEAESQRAEILKLVNEQFELLQSSRNQEIEKKQDELEALKSKTQKRVEAKDNIIKQRTDEILGTSDYPWDDGYNKEFSTLNKLHQPFPLSKGPISPLHDNNPQSVYKTLPYNSSVKSGITTLPYSPIPNVIGTQTPQGDYIGPVASPYQFSPMPTQGSLGRSGPVPHPLVPYVHESR